jgi:hypothetical protein
VDFSVSNIAYHEKEGVKCAFMLDFGSLHPVTFCSTPLAKTYRYCSVNAIADRLVTPKDDLESLGYVLLDAYFGINQSPLGNGPHTEATKIGVLQSCNSLQHGVFFQEYFNILDLENDTYSRLCGLAERYRNIAS